MSGAAEDLQDILAELDRCAYGEQDWLSRIGRHGQWLRVHRLALMAALRSTSARETLPSWMISQGYATGHGDTIEDLLGELKGQLDETNLRGIELQAKNDALAAALPSLRELNAALTDKLSRQAEQFDALHGTPCEQIRHAQEVEELKADIARKDEALKAEFVWLKTHIAILRDGTPGGSILGDWERRLAAVTAALQALTPSSKGDAS